MSLPPASVARRLDAVCLELAALAAVELGPLRAKVAPSDLVQDVCQQAVTHLGQFTGDSPQSFRAWVLQILRNRVRNLRRHFGAAKRAACREVPLTDDSRQGPCDSATASRIVTRREEAERLRAAIGRLPEHHRELIRRHDLEGQTFAEIGARIGRSADAVRMAHARALVRLRRELESS
jgi:RNA polymerase sigma-70 factor (subfamily 1)